jgi:hypothetical protein
LALRKGTTNGVFFNILSKICGRWNINLIGVKGVSNRRLARKINPSKNVAGVFPWQQGGYCFFIV